MGNSKPHKSHKEKKEKKKKKEKKSKSKKKEKRQKSSATLKGLAKSELKRLKDDKRTDDHHAEADFSVPIDLMYTKSHVPETPDEYKKRQSQLRRVTDPETGRTRLIKGDGEVIEEIVSKERHKQINKQATEGDGRHFESKTLGLKQA